VSTPLLTNLEDSELDDLRRSDVKTFEGRLPDPAEVIQWGGKPGVQYLMIDSRNLHEARNEPPIVIDGKEHRWGPIKDMDVYQVVGPQGGTTIMVLGRGKPIPGADPANGVRRWSYDRTILETTGLKSPYGGEPVDLPKPTKDAKDAK
jgi:hypothetical protein